MTENLKRRLKRLLQYVVAPLLIVSFIDAAAGGGVTIMLVLDNEWSPIDQLTNDFYQLAVGGLTISIVFLIALRARDEAIQLSFAFILMVNDTLYFLLQPAVAWIHDLIFAPGAGSTHINFPAYIAGWTGWLSRTFDFHISPIPLWAVLFSNAVWLGVMAYFILIDNDKDADKPQDQVPSLDDLEELSAAFKEAHGGIHENIDRYADVMMYEVRRLRKEQEHARP